MGEGGCSGKGRAVLSSNARDERGVEGRESRGACVDGKVLK